MMPKDADVISSRHNAKSRLYVFIHGTAVRQTGSGYICVDLVFVLVQHSSCLQLHSYTSLTWPMFRTICMWEESAVFVHRLCMYVCIYSFFHDTLLQMRRFTSSLPLLTHHTRRWLYSSDRMKNYPRVA